MYRVLIADDEGYAGSAEKYHYEYFGNDCELAFAKTGRAVVELARAFVLILHLWISRCRGSWDSGEPRDS